MGGCQVGGINKGPTGRFASQGFCLSRGSVLIVCIRLKIRRSHIKKKKHVFPPVLNSRKMEETTVQQVRQSQEAGPSGPSPAASPCWPPASHAGVPLGSQAETEGQTSSASRGAAWQPRPFEPQRDQLHGRESEHVRHPQMLPPHPPPHHHTHCPNAALQSRLTSRHSRVSGQLHLGRPPPCLRETSAWTGEASCL